MQNIVTKIDGNKLIIEIELDASDAVPSASGKTKLIASTHGAVKIANPKIENLSLNLSAYIPNR